MRRTCPSAPWALILACLAVLAGCADRAGPSGAWPEASPQAQALETEVLRLALQARADAGLTPPLPVRRDLADAARRHAADMAKRGYFDHETPEGRSALDRILAADPAFSGVLGENIAFQRVVPGTPFDPRAVARQIVAAWLDSPSHRQTLLSPLFTVTGVGAAVSPREAYVAQVFAGPVPRPTAHHR